jgi:hypothetical protein
LVCSKILRGVKGRKKIKAFVREDLVQEKLPGRSIWKAVGKDSFSISEKITLGFARYSAEAGPMKAHQHAEEILYITDARNGWIRCGEREDSLGEKRYLKAGMVLHIPELEWHVFGYDKDGFVDAVFFYGQVDNIRPEAK